MDSVYDERFNILNINPRKLAIKTLISQNTDILFDY